MVILHESNSKELSNWLSEDEARGIICYGVGNVFTYEVSNEIKQKVVGLIDKDEHKLKDEINGHKIIVASDIYNVDKMVWDKNCLLITTNFFPEVIADLNEKVNGFDVNVFVFPIFKYNDMAYAEIVDNRITKIGTRYLVSQNKGFGYEQNYNRIDHLVKEGKMIIPKIVFLLTTRCSLRCKECTGRIPYMPIVDFDVENVKKDIDRILSVVDEIETLQFAGGESLLYPKIIEILNYVVEKEKVKAVHFVTNGTLMPREEILEALSNSKVFIFISDYGYKEKLNALKDALDNKKINYTVLEELRWRQVGNLEKRNKSKEQILWEYWNCDNGFGCKMVVDGKMFACDRSGRMYLEQKLNDIECIYDAQNDMVNLYKYDEDELKKKIFELYTKKSIDACDHCDYANLRAVEVKPAEQL